MAILPFTCSTRDLGEKSENANQQEKNKLKAPLNSTPQRQPTVSSFQYALHVHSVGVGDKVGTRDRPCGQHPGTVQWETGQQTHTRDSAGHNEEQEACVSRGGGWQRLFFGFVFCFVFAFSRFSMLKNHTLLLQSEKDTFVQERKNS